MDWDLAIERHRKPLLRIVATLFALIGLREGAVVERLAWPLYRQVLRLLRPAEAAVRRLIIAAARDIVVKPRPKRPAPAKRASKGTRASKGQGRRSFQLFDPPQRCRENYRRRTPSIVRAEPRIHFFDFDARGQLYLRQFQSQAPAPPPRPAPKPRDTVNALPLCRRLAAIKQALEDLASQARRYARWRARPVEERRPKLDSPLRLGSPPGHRKVPTHAVHNILTECDWLASKVPAPDTS